MSKFLCVYTQDPGHGWLEVPRQMLHDLGIEYDISIFSYVKGPTAYLEEDDDMAKFIAAFKEEMPEVELDIRDKHIDIESPIRNYRPYPMSREAHA